MARDILHLITLCRESSVSATCSIIVFSSKLRLVLVLFFIRALEANCIVPPFPDTPVDRYKVSALHKINFYWNVECVEAVPKSENLKQLILLLKEKVNCYIYKTHLTKKYKTVIGRIVYVYLYMPDSDRCRWRPGRSSFHTFTVAGSSLSLEEAVLLSRVGGLSVKLILRIGMRLMWGRSSHLAREQRSIVCHHTSFDFFHQSRNKVKSHI